MIEPTLANKEKIELLLSRINKLYQSRKSITPSDEVTSDTPVYESDFVPFGKKSFFKMTSTSQGIVREYERPANEFVHYFVKIEGWADRSVWRPSMARVIRRVKRRKWVVLTAAEVYDNLMNEQKIEGSLFQSVYYQPTLGDENIEGEFRMAEPMPLRNTSELIRYAQDIREYLTHSYYRRLKRRMTVMGFFQEWRKGVDQRWGGVYPDRWYRPDSNLNKWPEPAFWFDT